MAGQGTHRAWQRPSRLKRFIQTALLARSGVVGSAVGLGSDGEAVVKIYTKSEGAAGLHTELDGVTVVMQATGEIVVRSDPKGTFFRPVPSVFPQEMSVLYFSKEGGGVPLAPLARG